MYTAQFNAKGFKPAFLLHKHIPKFLALQEKWRQVASEEEILFLKPRTTKDLMVHLDANMPIIGVRDKKGDLVGQAILAFPVNEDAVKNLEGYPIKKGDVTTAVVQSVLTDYELRGKKIAQIVLNMAKDMAMMKGHTRIVAKISAKNIPSLNAFKENGFKQCGSGIDPKLGYPVIYVECSLLPSRTAACSPVAFTPEMA